MSERPWAIYTRVSTDEQAREGVSLDAQLAACRAIMLAKSPVEPLIIDDPGWSGKDLRRPGMRRLLAMVDSGQLAGICIWKLDRLTRSLRDLLDLVERLQAGSCDLYSIQESVDTSGPIGRFTLSLMGALAQLEREQISERVLAARRHLVSQGYWPGGPIPAGCQVTGTRGRRVLERHPQHAAMVEPIWARVVAGESIQAILGHLQEHVPPAGKRWSRMAVWRLLRRREVVGVLVDEETWQAAQQALDQREGPGKAGQRSSRSQRVWPLREIARCGRCGSTLIGVRGGGSRPYLRCGGRIRHGRDHCPARDLPADVVEAAVIEGLQQLLLGDDGLLEDIAAASHQDEDQAGAQEQHERQLTRERDRLRRTIESTLDLLTDGDEGARRAAMPRLSRLQMQVDELEGQLEALAIQRTAAAAQRRTLAEQLEVVRAIVDDLPRTPPTVVAPLLQGLLDAVHIHDDRLHYVLCPQLAANENDRPGGGRRVVSNDRWHRTRDAKRTYDRELQLLTGRRDRGGMVMIATTDRELEQAEQLRSWSSQQLQDQLGVSPSTAYRIRSGRMAMATLCDLLRQASVSSRLS